MVSSWEWWCQTTVNTHSMYGDGDKSIRQEQATQLFLKEH